MTILGTMMTWRYINFNIIFIYCFEKIVDLQYAIEDISMQYSHAMCPLILEHMIGNMTASQKRRGRGKKLLLCYVHGTESWSSFTCPCGVRIILRTYVYIFLAFLFRF